MHTLPPFWVADLTAAGEVRLKQAYQYALLERVEGAVDLIALFSNHLWRTEEHFEVALPGSRLSLRWVACSPTSGLATLRHSGALASFSVLLTGREQDDDAATLEPFQRHLVRELHDTGIEPAFDLLELRERPLVASVHFAPPSQPDDQRRFALADRCFAASYFRKLGIA